MAHITEPTFDATTERVYGLLPQHYRDSDSRVDFQLKKYLAGLLSSQDEVNKVIERLGYLPPDEGGGPDETSDLVDPMTADLQWLRWLGQLFGAKVQGEVTDDTRNEVVQAAGFRAGTTDSIIAAVKSVLVDTKKVRIVKHANETWQSDMLERVYRTNIAPRPSFSSVNNISSGGGATLTSDTSWFQNGPASLKITSVGNVASAAYPTSGSLESPIYVNFLEGRTYTVSAYCRLSGPNTATGENESARKITIVRRDVDQITNYNWMTSTAAPNAAGVTRLYVTFTVPANTEAISIRFMNGSATAGDAVWWDSVLIEESDAVGDYFDGSSEPTGGYQFRWVGDDDVSPSQQYTPAVENTATEWDMLIMTLQSETLKNLLNQTLSKTLSASAWEDSFQSFGFDQNKIVKTLVKHPGVYQNRALAYYLNDPEWQAGVEQENGFGQTNFGTGTFGYSGDVVSRLRLLSRSTFDCVPTDSYQFMVSLGLKQDILDEKRAAIGFQFFDADDEIVTNTVATNYFPDPSFDYGSAIFALPGVTNGTGVVSLDTDTKHSGSQSIKIEQTDTGVTNETGSLGTPASFGLEVGDVVTLSAWVYIPDGVTPHSVLMRFDGAGITALNAAAPSARDEWTQISITTSVISDSGSMVPTLYTGTVNGDAIYFDDFGFTKGSDPVDFNGDNPDPADGSHRFEWVGTPGASASVKLSDVHSTPITVEPVIENTSIVSRNFVKTTTPSKYSPAGDDTSAVDIIGYGEYDGGNIIRAITNNNASVSDFGVRLPPVRGLESIPAGQLFTFKLDYRIAPGVSADGIRVVFTDDENADNTAVEFMPNTPALITTTVGRWHTRSWTAVVKPNRKVTSVSVLVESSLNQGSGSVLDTANWMIEEGSVANPYFNGDTPGDGTYVYQWEGVPDASVTHKVLATIAAQNQVVLKQYTTRFAAPAGAAKAKVFVDMDGFNGRDTLYLAQPGVREELDETWIAESSDPIQAVIDKGVKPAGIILHWKPLVSTWDSITAEGTRPWQDLNLPWVEVEELGL